LISGRSAKVNQLAGYRASAMLGSEPRSAAIAKPISRTRRCFASISASDPGRMRVFRARRFWNIKKGPRPKASAPLS